MSRLLKGLAITSLAIGAFQQAAIASVSAKLTNADRVIVFAVEQEIHATHLENRRDMCVGFARGVAVDEKGIISQLRRSNFHVHSDGWCNSGPRGLVISVLSPVNRSAPDEYELVAELGDSWPITREGAHFGTLVRRGTYKIKISNHGDPQLVSYHQACCSQTRISKP